MIRSSFSESISIDGASMPIQTASLPVTDRGFLFGDSIYEVFRTYRGVPLYFDLHWERFLNSAKLIHLEVPFSKDKLLLDIKNLCQYAHVDKGKDYYFRFILTRGDGFDLSAKQLSSPRLIILIKELPNWDKRYYISGISLWTPSLLRNSPRALDPNIKGGNYLNNILGAIEANSSDYDDAVFLNADSEVTESSTANIFFVFADRIATPSVNSGLLKGITRQALLDLQKINNRPIVEEKLFIQEIEKATEAFITSSTREVMPIKKIGSKANIINFNVDDESVTKLVSKGYKETILTHIDKYKDLILFS
jgi:branched-chain amino acid aminotransferase